MFGSMGQTNVKNLGNGGTMDGDVTITGDLTVSGGISLSLNEVLQGTSTIDINSTEALLVRKDGDGGDVFIVDTTNSRVGINCNHPSVPLEVELSGDTGTYFEGGGNGASSSESDARHLTITASTTTSAGDTHTLNAESGSGVLKFATSGSDRMIVKSSGVGIGTGTDTIDAPLHVKGGTANTAKFQSASGATNITLTDSSDSLIGQIEFSASASQIVTRTSSTLSLGSNNVQTLHITDDDRVGIGTASPNTLLTVSSGTSGDVVPILSLQGHRTGNYPYAKLSFWHGTDEDTAYIMAHRANSNDSSADITFNTANNGTNAEVMRVTYDNKVGIGTSSPDQLLHINAGGSDNAFIKLSTTGSGEAGLYIDGDDGDFSGNWTFIGVDNTNNNLTFNNVGADDIIFKTTNAERMRLTSGGSLGLGTDSPSTTLHIYSAEDYNPTITIENAHAGSRSPFLSFKKSSSSPANNDKIGQIQFNGNDATGSSRLMAFIEAYTPDITGGAYDGAFRFSQMINASQTEVMTITAGNVGIGISPVASQKLHVKASSDINFTVSAVGSALRLNAVNDAVSANVPLEITSTSTNFLSGNTTFAGNQVIYADGNIAMPATKALYFDGGTHTRIVESAGDVLDIYAGTNLALKLDTNSRISLSNNDASARNTIFGYQAMNVAGASASDNVAIGNEAMHDVGTSQFNVAVGSLALTKEVNGDRNTAIGYQSLYSQSNSGTEIPMNTAVGGFTGWTNVTGVFNTWLGGQAGFGSASGSNSNNVGIGYNAMLDVSTGSNNVAVGMQAGANITDNTDNVIVGYEAFFTANSGENENVIIGKHAGYYIDNAGADENVIIGKGAGQGGSGDLSGNIVIGANALDATGSNNLTGTIAIGHQALTNNVNGARNTVVGYQGMLDGTGAGDNVAIGYEVLKEGTTSELNVAVGTYALGSNSASALTGNGHVALGYKALYVAEGASANNTAVGANAMLDVTTGSDNVAMGINSLENLTSGSRNVALGYYTMAQSIDTNDNVAIGRYAMGAGDVASDGQVAIGSGSLSELTSGERNLAIGYQSLNQADVCDDSIAIGYQALAGTDAGTNSKNIAIGNYALDANLVNSVNNVAIGHNALTLATGGQSNVAIGGNGAGGAITTADRIVAIGDGALGGAVQSQGNTGVGYACLYNATGEKNTAFGYQTANTVTTGTENTVVGWDADASASGAVNQTVIGSETTGVADNSVTLGNASVTAVYMAQDSGATVHADKYMSTTMPAFLVQPNAQQNNIAVDTVTDIVFDVERFDQGSNFASNTFTAPVTGKYFLNVSLYGKQVDSASDYIQVYIVTSNRTYTMIIDPDFGQDASYWSFNNSVLADMDANDTAKIQVFQSTGSAQLDIGTASYFSGYLVC